MTRKINMHAARGVCRAASLLTGALMVAGLAACGSISSQTADTNASLTQKAKPSVSLSPVLGVPEKFASAVNTQLAADVKGKGIQIVEAKDADLVVKAAYTALPQPKKGTKVNYAIDVVDKSGTRLKHLEGDELVSVKRGGEAWSHVTQEAMTKVTTRSSNELTSWIIDPNAPAPQPAAPSEAVASAKPAKATKTAAAAKSSSDAGPSLAAAVTPASAGPAELTAVVPLVTGAPGDGKTALSGAMKKALAQQGIKVASAGGSGIYKIQGQVEMGQASNGTQPITIRWLVIDPSGKQMDKSIIQNNSVTAGQLDTTWGSVAEQAAGAAAAEVTKLMNKTPGGQAQQGSPGSAG